MRLTNLQINLVIFLSVILSILLCTLLWDKISVPFSNIVGAKGFLTEINYNPINDTIRYILFISFPLIIFLFLNLTLKKKFLKIKDLFFEKNIESKYKDSSLLLISFIFIVFIILEFLSLNLSNYRLDPLHDGDFLTPAQNYLFTGQFWLSSYTVHGGSDFFYPLFMWKILGTETIGAGRSFIFFLILIVKLSCILLSYQLTKISTLKDSSKILFFTIFAAILISMSHYEVPINYSYFSYRDIFVILFMIFFVELFTLSKIKYLSTVLICLIATISLLFLIDIGFYLNFILFFYIFYLFIIKKYTNILVIFLSLITFWFISISILSFDEFKAFLDHTKSMILSVDLMHGLKYPIPFFSIGEIEYGSRATRGLLLQLTAGLFILNYVFFDEKKIFTTKKIFFVFLFLLSFIMYKNALGRSDTNHLRMSADFPILINCFFILNYFLLIFESKIKLKIKSPKKIYFASSIIFLLFFYIINSENYRINNIVNFNSNFSNYIKLSDENFIDKKTIKLIDYYNKINEENDCVQNFTYDLAMPYLMKKPSCTKYFSSWIASPTIKQEDYINEIIHVKPQYILYKSSGTNFGLTYKVESPDISERLALVNSYILTNYKKHKEFEDYIILEKK